MTTNAVRNRAVAAAFAVVGALSLAACGPDDTAGTATSTPTQSSSTSSTTSSDSSSSSSTSSSDTSSSTESSTSSDSSTSTESSTGGSTASGPVTPSDKNATFSFGDPAVIEDDDETYRLTVKDLQVAPDSVYSQGLDKAKGTVYFVNFEVSPIKIGSTGKFRTSAINGLFLHPDFASGQTARRMYGDVDACKTDSTATLQVGEVGKGCYIYQITGDKSSKVVYNDYEHNLTWK